MNFSKLALSIIVLVSVAACTKERPTSGINARLQNASSADASPTPLPSPVTDPTPVPSPTPVTDPTPIQSATPVPTATPVTDPTPVPTPKPTPVPTATPIQPTPTPDPTATPKPTPTATPSASPTPSATPKPTATPNPTPTASPNPSPGIGCGEAEITLSRPVDSFTLDVYRSDYRIDRDNHVWGYTWWGADGHIRMSIDNDEYKGRVGNFSPVDITCAQDSCSGKLEGHAAQFTTSTDAHGNTVITGQLHNHDFKITRNAHDIFIDVNNGTRMELHHMTRHGRWEGRAIYFDSLNCLNEFYVILETDGSLRDIPDNTLLTLFMGAPLAKGVHH